jgi:preprotein translocase subunit SecD
MRGAARAGLVALLAATLLAAGCSSSSKTESTPLPTVATPSTVSSAVSSKLSLEFRPVKAIVSAKTPIKVVGGSGSTSRTCATLITPAAARKPSNASEMLFDRRRTYCYLVGPTLVSGSSVDSATVAYDSKTGSWGVNVHFDDDAFLTKIARPLVNQRIAVVLAGFVQAVATINPGLTGHTFEILGSFTQGGAADVAAAILGIAPSSVHVTGGS